MKALRVIAIVLCLALVLFIFGCAKQAEEPAPKAPPASSAPPASPAAPEPGKAESHYSQGLPAEANQGIMADVGKLMEAWMAQPTDFTALAERYQPNLAKYVQDADKKFGTTLDQEIAVALKDGAEGKYVAGNRQIIQKGIQTAFILNFTAGVKAIGEVKTDAETLKMVEETGPAIKMIAERRDKSLEKGSEFQDAFAAISGKLFAAAKGGDAAAAKASADEMLNFTTKIILLSVLYEVKGLEQARGKSADEIAGKCEESRMYYRNLKDVHQKRNPEGAASVDSQLSRKPEEVDTDLIQKVLAADFKAELAGLDPVKLGM